MTATRTRKRQQPTEPQSAEERCPCTDLASVSERSALAAGRYLGRGDPTGADDAASAAMVKALDTLPVSATVVIGREQGALAPGVTLAACEPGGMTRVPRMYMKKMAVGPVAKGRIDLRESVTDNLLAIADAFGRKVGDITAVVLDRPRHEDLIAEIREAGARIKVIADGDITATIDAAIRGTNDHLAVGIGGAFEGIISAAALSCLGGEIQGQLWPMSRTEIRQANDHGIADVEQIFGIDDLVRGDQMVVGTGISNGDLLRGVRYFAEGARTQSIVLCSRCNRVRFIDSIHLFSRDRHEEIRL
jgi:fructose-1,6-bisphosphatase II